MEGQRCASIELFNQSICQREMELMTVFNVMLASWTGPKIHQIIQTDYFRNTSQCALWAVRWPCGILAVAIKTLSHGKNNIF